MATAKSPATATPKEQIMATKTEKQDFDFTKLSVEDKLALAKQLEEAAKAESIKLFDDTMNFLVEKLKAMGRTKADAVKALTELMDASERATLAPTANTPAVKRTRAPRGSKPAKVLKSADADGNTPEVGKTYKLNNMVWKKEKAVGAVKKEFMDAVQHGAKWKEMEVAA